MLRFRDYGIDVDPYNYIIKKIRTCKDTDSENFGKDYETPIAYFTITGGLQLALNHLTDIYLSEGLDISMNFENIVDRIDELKKFIQDNFGNIKALEVKEITEEIKDEKKLTEKKIRVKKSLQDA
jgi:hypothetical protein